MKEKLTPIFRQLKESTSFVVLDLFALGILFLLRVYEALVFIVKGAPAEGYFEWGVRALFYDLRFGFFVFLLLGLLTFPMSISRKKLAVGIHAALLGVLLIIHLLLVKYFGTTLEPLGKELFSYSVSDIVQTTGSSLRWEGPDFILIFLTLICVLTLVTIFSRWEKFEGGGKGVVIFYIFTLISPVLLFISAPGMEQKRSANKLEYFARKVLEPGRAKVKAVASSAEYPLLRDAVYDNVLGTYFNLGAQKPNVVVIIVEGLGSTVLEKGRLGGFTPFIDTLAREGLSWSNFFSTSGRTFGVLPALLASLPHAENGIMSLEKSMPHHLSLLGILKENGYSTRFFHGSNADFDQMRSFFNRHEIDLLVDQHHFAKDAEKAAADEGGFSWGNPDGALFKRGINSLPEAKSPSLDIYLTISTHEPFIPPNKDHYLDLFRRKLEGLQVSPEVRGLMESNEAVFSTFLYTDEALKDFFEAYRKHPSYSNTIFVITGDHRMIPVPERNPIDRYHVPFIVYSALLKEAREFPAVSSHLDFVPSLLSLLRDRYELKLPEKVHWLGKGLDTHPEFRADRTVAFMRAKDAITDYLSGNHFFSGGKVYELLPGAGLKPLSNPQLEEKLSRELVKHEQMSIYVCENDKIYPFTQEKKERRQEFSRDELTYENARKLAFEKDFEGARKICNELLKINPNYHDVRALLGRTYAWQKDYEKARQIYNELIQMAPEYPDGYAALAYLELWSDKVPEAEALVDKSLKLSPQGQDYLVLKARILKRTQREAEALAVVEDILTRNPTSQEALELKKSLSR